MILGYQSLESIGPGAPEDPNALWPKKWLEETHILELPSMTEGTAWNGEIASIGSHGKSIERRWEKIACYGQGVDWFGDGSFWLLANEGVRLCPVERFKLCFSTNIFLSDKAYRWTPQCSCASDC